MRICIKNIRIFFFLANIVSYRMYPLKVIKFHITYFFIIFNPFYKIKCIKEIFKLCKMFSVVILFFFYNIITNILNSFNFILHVTLLLKRKMNTYFSVFLFPINKTQCYKYIERKPKNLFLFNLIFWQ